VSCGSFIAVLVWSIVFHLPKFLLLMLVFAYIYISQGSVETHYPVVGYIIVVTLLQIVCRVCQWKNFENRSIIDEDMDKSKVARFWWPTVYLQSWGPILRSWQHLNFGISGLQKFVKIVLLQMLNDKIGIILASYTLLCTVSCNLLVMVNSYSFDMCSYYILEYVYNKITTNL